ncbi:hypothetical protein PR202_ga21496 [Eleusine coracana subsp. coracana]|uniref:RanBP2-type domain-containing protein n=1 Tax=Eleusine coracana subsp. coracana TaxID=191504 RepID=A0AAV5D0S5_ELECO|nr:hypothetical protein PR202_ga21496 [Eleusine coracana subsp. coracana]
MSSQVDNRSQSAGKRARTDGGRREDDWVCPSCGNVNFAFRTTCNMRNCNQSRPAERAKPMQTPPHYGASGGYMGPGTPPSMYMGGMYGIPMDRYGLAIPAGPGAMGTRAGSYSDEGTRRSPQELGVIMIGSVPIAIISTLPFAQAPNLMAQEDQGKLSSVM